MASSIKSAAVDMLRRKTTSTTPRSKKEEDENDSPMDLLSTIRNQILYHDKHITTFHCEMVCIGNFTSKADNHRVNFSPHGIMFTAMSIVNGIAVENAIPCCNIQKIYQNLKGTTYFVVVVDRAGAYLIKQTLEFDSDRARRKRYLFEPTKGVASQRFLTFTLADKNIESRVGDIKKFYGNKVVDITGKANAQMFYEKVTGQTCVSPIFVSNSELGDLTKSDDEPCYLFSIKKDVAHNKVLPSSSPNVLNLEEDEITVVPASSSSSSSLPPSSPLSLSSVRASLSPRLNFKTDVKSPSQSPHRSENSKSTSLFASFPKERIIPITFEGTLDSLSPSDDELPENSIDPDVSFVPPSPSLCTSQSPQLVSESDSSNNGQSSSSISLSSSIKWKSSSTDEHSARNPSTKKSCIDVIEIEDSDGMEIENQSLDQILFIYPREDQESNNKVAIRVSDIQCLDVPNWLNDNIIDFWSRYFYLEKLSVKDRTRSHVFSSLFYPSLLRAVRSHQSTGKQIETPWPNYTDSVSVWVKNLDIFSKDFLFVPISDSYHWVLAAICFPGVIGTHPRKRRKANREKVDKRSRSGESSDSSEFEDSDYEEEESEKGKHACILIMDSMSDEESRNGIFDVLRVFLSVEWNSKNSSKMDFTKDKFPGHFLSVPQQPNFSDCGIYVLKFLEMFFEKPIRSYEPPLPNKNNWFTKEIAATFRSKMYSEIAFYMNTHCPDNIQLMPKPAGVPSK